MDKLVHSASFAPASSLYLSIALQPYFGYHLEVKAPPHKAALFGTKGGK